MLVRNNTKTNFRLPSGHLLEAGVQGQVSKSVLNHPDNGAFLEGLSKSGKISIGVTKTSLGPLPKTIFTPAKKHKPFTRSWLASVNSEKELADIIEAHGVTPSPGARVDDLRNLASSLMFVDL